MGKDAAESRGFSDAEVAVLRHLPARLLREGYIDAYCSLCPQERGVEEVRRLLEHLPPSLQMLIRLFALCAPVEHEALRRVLQDEEIAALRRLGLLLLRGERYHTGGLVLMPLWGQLLFVPHPASGGEVYFGDDSAALAARLSPARHARCLDLGAGPGAHSLRLCTLARSVVAVEENPVALACAELNVMLNAVEDRVELRRGTLYEAVSKDERFDFVAACPAVLPCPPALASPSPAPGGDDGMLALRRVLGGLPGVLEPGGVAQMIASGAGDHRGPGVCAELLRFAETHGMQVAMTLTARVRLRPGDRLFELLASRLTRLGRLTREDARQRLEQHYAAIRAEYLYRFFLCIGRGGSDAPALRVASFF